jgi:hypothetical protein
MRIASAVAAAFLAFVSCGSSYGGTLREDVSMPRETLVADDVAQPVIIVTVDGVMWQDVFSAAGRRQLPHLFRGATLGAPEHGSPMLASGPNFISLPGYTELFEGRVRTGCTDNTCAGATIPTLVDEIRAQHLNPCEVAVITSWEPIAYAATVQPHGIVLSAGSIIAQGNESTLKRNIDVNRAYELGRGVSAWPGHADYRPDRFTAALALAYLRIERPSMMFVGLGDTDEFAHRDDRAGYDRALHYVDGFVGSLEETLSYMGNWGKRTLIFVTSDHGRCSDFRDHGACPESARSWMFVLGSSVTEGFISAPVPRRLADIAPTIRRLVGLPQNALSDGVIMNEVLNAVHSVQ